MLSKILNLIIAILLLAVLFTSIDLSIGVWGGKEETRYMSIEEIASGPGGIFSDFIFPFELLSLLLIAALIGALYIAKKEAL
jgi:NADH:ubiquinone oxidoreductase subunit 6 (subunit J)